MDSKRDGGRLVQEKIYCLRFELRMCSLLAPNVQAMEGHWRLVGASNDVKCFFYMCKKKKVAPSEMMMKKKKIFCGWREHKIFSPSSTRDRTKAGLLPYFQ